MRSKGQKVFNLRKIILLIAFCSSFLCHVAIAGSDMQLSPEQIKTLKNFAAQNPQAVSQIKSAVDNGQGVQSLDPKTQASLQSLLSQNPQLASSVRNMLAGKSSASQSKPSQQSTPSNAAQSKNVGDKDQKNLSAKPYHPWQPATQAEADARNKAFRGVANQAFPLSPQQIKLLNSMLDKTQRAQAAAPNDRPPMPTSSSLIVNLDPGSTPPVIRLSKGFITSLVFIDETGAAWPIAAYDLGNPKAFNIQWDKKSNTLMVQALATYTYGNLAVKLKGKNTPVMLTLVPGQQQIDYRVDLRIEGQGPNAKPTIQGSDLPEQADKTLLNILDGISPRGARQLNVTGGFAQAWLLNNTLYVRTRFTLLSPAWLSKMSSADGMNAYKLQTTPMLLVSRYGKVQQLKVEGL